MSSSDDSTIRDPHGIPWRDLTDDERAVLQAESLEWLRQHGIDVDALQQAKDKREAEEGDR